jgi:hypothetical protein
VLSLFRIKEFTMSLASAAVSRLRKLSRRVFLQNARANAQRQAYPASLHVQAALPLMEQLEPRVMLSASFAQPLESAVGVNPNDVAVADLDNDGVDDMIVVNTDDSTLSVLYGLGDGTFDAAVDYDVGNGPMALTVGHFDGDAYLDVASANNDSTVSIYYGQADGSLADRQNVDVGTGAMDIVGGDFDGDAYPDFAVTNWWEGTVSVLYGQSDGSFAEREDIAVGDEPSAIVVGDLNGNGRMDLAVANSADDSVTILYGDVGNGFSTSDSYLVGTEPGGIDASDFNDDGALDLVVTNTGDNNVSILFGMGSGIFGERTEYAVGDMPGAVITREINGDEYTDLIITNDDSDSVTVLFGQSGGGFGGRMDVAVGSSPHGLSTGDFNNDLIADLAVVNSGDDSVSVLLGQTSNGFGTRTDIDVGSDPEGVVSADFDGDGLMDLAVTNLGNNISTDDVIILYGQTGGGYGDALEVEAGWGSIAVVTADFNNDTRPDLAVLNTYDDDVSILYGLEGGGFGGRLDVAVGGRPTGIVTGDFNGDTRPDLAVTNTWDNDISILYGQADGSLVNGGVDVAAGGPPGRIATGDFDDDSRLDLAITNGADDVVSVLYGLEAGGFGNRVDVSVGDSPNGIVVGNFDADDLLDFAVTNSNVADYSVSILYGQVAGGFGDRLDVAVGSAPRGITSGHFNGDARRDLAVVNAFDDDISILYSQADGSFTRMDVPVGDYPQRIVAAHLNDDGYMDLAVTNQNDDDVSILYSGQANLEVSDVSSEGIAVQPGGEVTLTFTTSNDGDADAVPVGQSTFETQLFLSDDNLVTTGDTPVGAGTGTFAVLPANSMLPQTFTFTAPTTPGTYYLGAIADGDAVVSEANEGDNWSWNVTLLVLEQGWFADRADTDVGDSPEAVAVADFDGDGELDLAVANGSDNDVSILFGQGDGSFDDRADYATGTNPFEMVTGDFDGDGQLDVATVNSFVDTVTVWHGQADGTFTDPQQYGTGSGPEGIVAGDFDGDGYLDVAVTNHYGASVTVLYGFDGGDFDTALEYSTAADGGPAGIAAADFNGDGHLDLAAVNHFDDTVSVLFGDGARAFAAPFDLTMEGGGNRGIAVADFDGNGGLDIAVTSMFENTVTVLYGNGGGVFASTDTFDVGEWPEKVVAADFNDDGIPDLAVTGSEEGVVSVLYGLVSGGFTDAHSYAVGGGALGIASADLDGDGLLDLATTNYDDDDVSVLYGQSSEAPNLEVTDITPTEKTVIPGASVTLEITTENTGTADATPEGASYFETALFLSTDDSVDETDTQVAAPAGNYNSFASGATSTRTFTFSAPTTPGTYYLRAIADGVNNRVDESDETDNWSGLVTLTVLSDTDIYDRDHAEDLGEVGNAAQVVKGAIGKTATNIDYNDWYTFTITGRRKITATLTGLTRDANLQLTDKDGMVLKTSEKTSTSNEKTVYSAVPTNPLDPGTYYLRVYTTSNKKTAYSLSVKAVNDTEKNGWARATDLGTPGSKAVKVSDQFGGVDMNDWFKFKVKGVKKVTVRVDNMTSGVDMEYQIKETTAGVPDDDTIAGDKVSGGDTQSSDVGVLTAGTYYIRMTTEDTTASPYRLRVSATGDTDFAKRTTAKNAGKLGAAVKTYAGQLGAEDRNDWYKFTTTRTRYVTLALKDINGDFDLQLCNAKGKVLKTSAEDGDTNESIIKRLKAGTYYARVLVRGSSNLKTGLDYTLELSAAKTLPT